MPSRRDHKPSSIGGPSQKTGRKTIQPVSREVRAILNKVRNTCDASQNPIHGQRRGLSLLVTENTNTNPHGHVLPQSPPQSDADLPVRLQSSRGVPKPRVTIQEQDNENACETSDGSGNSGDSDSSGNRGSRGFFAGDGPHFPKSDLGTRPGSRERRTSTLTALFKTRPASKTTAGSNHRHHRSGRTPFPASRTSWLFRKVQRQSMPRSLHLASRPGGHYLQARPPPSMGLQLGVPVSRKDFQSMVSTVITKVTFGLAMIHWEREEAGDPDVLQPEPSSLHSEVPLSIS